MRKKEFKKVPSKDIEDFDEDENFEDLSDEDDEFEEETKEKDNLKTKKSNSFLVVQSNQIPQQPVKSIIGEDGKEYNLISIEEAIQEILEKIRKL